MDVGNTLVIVLNGPPRAGKDTGIEALVPAFPTAEVFQFFRPIKEMLHRELGLDVPYDHYEMLKDVPLDEFGGLTPRYAYIARGDRHEEQFGPDALTDTYFAAIASCRPPILITTCGKDSEAMKIAEIFGVENTLVLRIHRQGKDFSRDSRSFVVNEALNIKDVHNVPDKQAEYQVDIVAVVRDYIASMQPAVGYAA